MSIAQHIELIEHSESLLPAWTILCNRGVPSQLLTWRWQIFVTGILYQPAPLNYSAEPRCYGYKGPGVTVLFSVEQCTTDCMAGYALCSCSIAVKRDFAHMRINQSVLAMLKKCSCHSTA